MSDTKYKNYQQAITNLKEAHDKIVAERDQLQKDLNHANMAADTEANLYNKERETNKLLEKHIAELDQENKELRADCEELESNNEQMRKVLETYAELEYLANDGSNAAKNVLIDLAKEN